MVLRREDKKAVIAEIAEIAQNSHSVVAVEYRGLSVEEITKLRALAREGLVVIKVVKNTLACLAFENTHFACIKDQLKGPIMLAFSTGDYSSAARIMRDFAKTNEKLVVRALSANAKLFKADEIDRLANLPTQDVALASLLSVMQAPLIQFIRTLQEPYGKLTRTFLALSQHQTANA